MSSRPPFAPRLRTGEVAAPSAPLVVKEDYERLAPIPPDAFLQGEMEGRTTTLAAALIPPDQLGPWLHARMGGAARPAWRRTCPEWSLPRRRCR